MLTDAGVTFDTVRARIKTWPSLKAKARSRDGSGNLAYPNPWEDINDIIGVRITVFHSTEIPRVLRVLGKTFEVLRSVDKTAETRVSGSFGYGSHHVIVKVRPNTENLEDYPDNRFEVQVRTVLQHAWAEFEHDIRYKRGSAPVDPRIDRSFALAAGLIELADQQFDQIATLHEHPSRTEDHGHDMALSVDTLPGILAMLLGDAYPRSRSETYRWLLELLGLNGIETVDQLRDLLRKEAIIHVTAAFNYRFTPAQVRLIDDLLLYRFGENHIRRTSSSGRRANQRERRLKKRLALLRAL